MFLLAIPDAALPSPGGAVSVTIRHHIRRRTRPRPDRPGLVKLEPRTVDTSGEPVPARRVRP